MTDYTSAEFWKGAPEGATGYLPETGAWNAVWVKQVGDALFAWMASGDTQWDEDDDSEEVLEFLIPRPAPQWSGEGLPPVGIDIEVMHGTYGWIGARVVGADGEAAIVRTNDGYAGVFPHEFRPIRTPSQIAAEERESFARNLVTEMGKDPEAFPTSVNQALKIYDLGYRKGETK